MYVYSNPVIADMYVLDRVSRSSDHKRSKKSGGKRSQHKEDKSQREAARSHREGDRSRKRHRDSEGEDDWHRKRHREERKRYRCVVSADFGWSLKPPSHCYGWSI